MKAVNYAPVYACMYPELAELTRKHGYALAIHGSLSRDFDLVCIPWSLEQPSAPQTVVDNICSEFAIQTVGEPETKQHGRLVYTITLSYGECFLDLSFMPALENTTL